MQMLIFRNRKARTMPEACETRTVPSETDGTEHERAVALVNMARKLLLPWAEMPNNLSTHQMPTGASKFEKFGNVDGAAILIRIARLAEPDGSIRTESFLERFMAEAERIVQETLESISIACRL